MEQRLKCQPLRCEAVEQRHPGDRESADEECAAAPRQTPQQATEAIELECSRRPFERAGAEKEKRLERRMVDHMQERSAERERGPLVSPVAAQQETGAETERDDAEVLRRWNRQEAASDHAGRAHM